MEFRLHSRPSSWSVRERRLIFRGGAPERQAALESAEQQGGSVAPKASLHQQLQSQTAQVAERLEEKCTGWFNRLAIGSSYSAKREIREAAKQRLAQASEKWNSWVYRILHSGERRLLLAEARARVTQDLLTYMEGKKSEILQRRQRFGRAASFLRSRSGSAISAAELKRKQNISRLLGEVNVGYQNAATKASKGLTNLRIAGDKAEMLRIDLLEAGLPADQLLPLLGKGNLNVQELRREIDRLHLSRSKKKSLMRTVRDLSWYRGRVEFLGALESDPNALPEREKLQSIDRDGMRGRGIEVNLNGVKTLTSVVSRSSPMVVLRDYAKPRGMPGAYMVLDTHEGKLLTRQGGHMIEHDVLHEKNNRIRIPYSSAPGLSLAA